MSAGVSKIASVGDECDMKTRSSCENPLEFGADVRTVQTVQQGREAVDRQMGSTRRQASKRGCLYGPGREPGVR